MTSINHSFPVNNIPDPGQSPGKTGKAPGTSEIAQIFSDCRCDNNKSGLPLAGHFSSLQAPANQVPDFADAKPGKSINNNSEPGTLDKVLDVTGKVLDAGLRITDFML